MQSGRGPLQKDDKFITTYYVNRKLESHIQLLVDAIYVCSL